MPKKANPGPGATPSSVTVTPPDWNDELKRASGTRNETAITQKDGKPRNQESTDSGDDTDVNRCPAGTI